MGEVVEFESTDPAFAGAMTVTTTLMATSDGTVVTMSCANVPRGISARVHQAGIASSRNNLAAFVEERAGRSPVAST